MWISCLEKIHHEGFMLSFQSAADNSSETIRVCGNVLFMYRIQDLFLNQILFI